MARGFNGSTDRLTRTGSMGVNFTTFSATGMGKPTSAVTDGTPTSIADTTALAFRQVAVLSFAGTVSSSIQLYLAANAPGATAQTSTSFSAGVWQVASVSNPNSASRSAYLNGSGKGSDSTTVVPVIVSATAEADIGCFYGGGSRLNFFNGSLCEIAWFADGLSDRQNAALGAGACPLLASMNVKAYWPLWPGNTGTEPGLIRGTALTATGTTSARHGPVFARHTGGV